MASPNIIVQLSASGNSPVQPVNFDGPNPAISLQFVNSGAGTYEVQFTQYDPAWENYEVYPDIYAKLGLTGNFQTDAVWGNHETMVNMTGTAFGTITAPVRAVRLVCTAYTSGTGTLIITQPAHR